MASNTLQIKRSSTFDATGNPTTLGYGELAWSNANEKLFVGKQTDSGGTVSPFHIASLKDITGGDGITATVTAGLADNSIDIALSSSVAGAGLAHASGVLSVGVDDSSIQITGDTINVKSGGVTNDMLDGSISNANLANAKVVVTDGSTPSDIALGGTLTFAGTDNEVAVAQSGGTVTVSLPDDVTIGDKLTVTGDLEVGGTTTTVNSNTVTIDDPVFTLGGDTAPSSETSGDRGIEFRYHNGTSAKIGFFGFDKTDSTFRYIPDATNSSEAFSGSVGNAEFASIKATAVTDASIDAGTF